MFSYKSTFQNKIKIYADGADFNSMIKLNNDPKIKGLTTNPSLMKQAGIKEYVPFCKSILAEIKEKPISFEVFADDFPTMMKQAKEIATWGKNVYVKIPITNSKGESSIPLIKELSSNGVQLNITAIFTLEQTTNVCQAVKGGAPSVVSIFAGRIADAGVDPRPLMQAAAGICSSTDKNIELLWASCREVFNVVEAEMAGCEIITIPPAMYEKMKNFGKDLNQYSLETVLMFKNDAETVGYKI